jgi:hypothetical protein
LGKTGRCCSPLRVQAQPCLPVLRLPGRFTSSAQRASDLPEASASATWNHPGSRYATLNPPECPDSISVPCVSSGNNHVPPGFSTPTDVAPAFPPPYSCRGSQPNFLGVGTVHIWGAFEGFPPVLSGLWPHLTSLCGIPMVRDPHCPV